MNVVHERCCGIDVHKQTVVACVIVPSAEGKPQKETRTFSTMTGDLTALAQWLKAQGCTHVAMESTGVYWKPVYNLLDGQFEILVVNAEHLKKIAGRKTDVQAAEWIADLRRHGLLKGSFIPSAEQRALRDLTRYRTTLMDERAREVNRVQKFLEDANIKLASVATDVLGASGRAILDALVAGKTDPGELAELAKGRLRHKKALLEKALTGTVKPHQRRLLICGRSPLGRMERIVSREQCEWRQTPAGTGAARRCVAQTGARRSGSRRIAHQADLPVCPISSAGGTTRF